MAGLSTIDFTQGIDFTGLANATAADHNSLINLATPKDDGAFGGKGMVISTIDSALNTPVVPDANSTTKWRRYLWIRKPHSSEPVSTTPMIYAWDENTENDATYQKWVQTNYSIAFLEADVAELQGLYNGINVDVQSSLTIANAANTLANTASNAATAANAKADAAQTLATTGNLTANQALTKATDAVTQANNALAAASAKRLAKDALIPGTAGQMLRVKSDGSEVEWFNVKDTYVKCYANARQALTSTAQWVAIAIQIEEQDTGNLCSIVGNQVKLLAGTYYVKVVIPVSSLDKSQVLIGNNTTKQVLLKSTLSEETGSYTLYLAGVITLTAESILDLFIYRSQSGFLSYGTGGIDGAVAGLPAGYGNVAESNVYTTFEAWKIG